MWADDHSYPSAPICFGDQTHTAKQWDFSEMANVCESQNYKIEALNW